MRNVFLFLLQARNLKLVVYLDALIQNKKNTKISNFLMHIFFQKIMKKLIAHIAD